jgi:hypothetical protein
LTIFPLGLILNSYSKRSRWSIWSGSILTGLWILDLFIKIKNIKLKLFFYKSCPKRSKMLRFSWKRWSRTTRLEMLERPEKRKSLRSSSRRLSLLSLLIKDLLSLSSELRSTSWLIRLISPRLLRKFLAIFHLTFRRLTLRKVPRKSPRNNKKLLGF